MSTRREMKVKGSTEHKTSRRGRTSLSSLQGHGRPPSEVKVTTSGGFADTTDVTLRYTTRISISSGLSPGYYQFRGNGPFDPDYTSTGGQPANWDLYAGVYQRYVCYGSKIDVKLTCVATATAMPIAALAPLMESSVPGFDDLISNPYSRQTWINGATGAHNRMQHQMSTAKIFGLTDDQVNSDNQFHSQYSAVPTPFYWTLSQESFDRTTTNVAYYQVTIDYRVRFYDRFNQDLDLALGRRALAQKAFLDCAMAKSPPSNVRLFFASQLDRIEKIELKEGRKDDDYVSVSSFPHAAGSTMSRAGLLSGSALQAPGAKLGVVKTDLKGR